MNVRNHQVDRGARRVGYSLIELVVVLTILAIVAGTTVSIVSWLRRSADKAAASNIMASLASNLELYRTTQGNYPNQFDSLIESAGSNLYDGDAGVGDTGLPSDLRAGANAKLTTTTLAAGEVSSLSKVGITIVMDHVAGSGVEAAPGSSGTVARPIDTSGQLAIINTGTAKGLAIVDSVYPPAGASGTGLPAGVKLIVFGFGPRVTSIGKTLMAPPSYSGVGDPSTIYDRFLPVFAVYSDGKRAQLKAVLDTKGDFLYQEMSEFYDNKPE